MIKECIEGRSRNVFLDDNCDRMGSFRRTLEVSVRPWSQAVLSVREAFEPFQLLRMQRQGPARPGEE